MKTLLVISRYKSTDAINYYNIPFGILYISSYLKLKGFDVHCLNMNHYNPTYLLEFLNREFFDVIGIGGLFTDIKEIGWTIQEIRHHSPLSKIILGGAVASAHPEVAMKILKPDFLVIGEGEVTTENLLHTINNNNDIAQVTGIAYLKDGKFIQNPPTPPIKDLDELPYPDYDGFEYEKYLENYTMLNNLGTQERSTILNDPNRSEAGILTSRDCVSKCTFCFRLMGNSYRLRNIDEVIREMTYLMDKYNITEFGIMDDMFSATKKRVAEFCEKVKPLNLKWRAQLRVNAVDQGLLRQMKNAGCYGLSYGFESGSLKVLKSMRKGTTPKMIEKAVRLTKKEKIIIRGNFIFGDPAETLDTMNETIRLYKKLQPLRCELGSISPYPGTKLYFDLIKKGHIKDIVDFYGNPDSEKYFNINMTSLSDTDRRYIHEKILNVIHVVEECATIIQATKIKGKVFDIIFTCPHCHEVCEKKGMDFNLGQTIVCKNCYQRCKINRANIDFKQFHKTAYHLYQLYILRPFLSHPFLFRLFDPSFERLKELLRPTWVFKALNHFRVI